jgi:phosphate transport system substrate-binding protein
MLVAVLAGLALIAGACSSDGTDTSTGNTSGGSGTTAAGADIDYESLTGTINGAGATFPKAFYESAIEAFKDVAPNLTVVYPADPGGSGKGKTQLADNLIQWAGTDSPVADADKGKFKGPFLYFPTVAAPITVSYNLSGVDEIKLDADTLAKIFLGAIKTWNDPAIAALNSGTDLPSTAITPVVRSDGSGTSSNFTKYLKAAAPDSFTIDPADQPTWPTGTRAENGNPGIANAVKQTNGAIGYVDFSDAVASDLTFASIKNKDGNFVEASLDGASAALAGADVKPDLTYSALNAAGADAYPITAGTYILVYAQQPSTELVNALRGWINYILTEGQSLAPDVDFAPLPSSLQQKAVAQLDQITTA